MPQTTFLKALIIIAGIFGGLTLASAQQPPDTSAGDPREKAWLAADRAMQRGPATITLLDQAKLNLPGGFGFVPKKEGAAAMAAMGNVTRDDFLGLILPTTEGQDWLATLDFEKEGYIKDDDADRWKPDELLENLKKGTEQSNEFRIKQGGAALEVTGWIEPPAYDKSSHRLVWSAVAKEKAVAASARDSVNYNTYLLGRDGYISLNFITSKAAIDGEKRIARELLADVAFNEGKRYSDFKSGSDHVAEYGLAALIGGVALKKLGLFAVMAAFAGKFIKVIAIATFAGLAALKKYLPGKKS